MEPQELVNTQSLAPVDAVVLAGSVNHIRLYPGNQPGYKALVELLGRPLIAYVLDALTASPLIARIMVVGPAEVREYASRWSRVTGVPAETSLIDNAWAGLRAAHTPRALFCNPDQPMLRTEMVDDFLIRAERCDAEIVSSWTRQEAMGPQHEEQGRHKVARFGDGWFAHGNLFLVRRELPELAEARARMDAMYRARKSTLRFAWALGPELFFRFLKALVTGVFPPLAETLRLGGRHFGVTIDGVISPYPEIALDVDEPEDYAATVRFLTQREKELRAPAVNLETAIGTETPQQPSSPGRWRESVRRGVPIPRDRRAETR
jgi:CTP:molybdopterin cytidylyltransferase MocA